MIWYYKVAGGHTHVRVFMNGAKCGDLCFRNDEFGVILSHPPIKLIRFVNETEADK